MFKEKILETNHEYDLINPGDKVLIAVSGGVDSLALMHLLYFLKDELEISLYVAHLNHMLRKKDSEIDANYVKAQAENLGMPITIEEIDVAAFAEKNKLGIEEAARMVRYEFFDKIAEKIGANKIALGHTADDNVETFLMRLLRGSGMKGLSGIPAKRGKIIRPLIKIWRKELEFYVGGLKLVPRRDYTNYESKYFRNRVRMKLIPQLKLYNLNIKGIILQTILLLTEELEYLESKAQEALNRAIVFSKDGETRLAIGKIKEVDCALQNHLLRQAIEKVKGDLSNIYYCNIRDILNKLGTTEKWELNLSQFYVAGSSDELILARERPKALSKKSFHYKFNLPGEINIKELGKNIKATLLESGFQAGVQSDPKIALLDFNAFGKEVIVRSREEGDRFQPLGMDGSKKIQDFFVDAKIPFEDRDFVPVVESNGKIIWVGGLRIDERARITSQTRKAVKLELV